MYADENKLKGLLERYDSLEKSEFDELFAMIRDADNDEMVKRILMKEIEELEIGSVNEEKLKEILGKIIRENPDEKVRLLRPRFVRVRKWAVAASIIFVIGIGSYFLFLNKTTDHGRQSIAKTTQDVNPGKYKAKLTISDGSTIILDSASNGQLTKQGNVVVVNKDGQLVYSPQSTDHSQETVYNTLSTAKGESYSTVLSDGSKIWLNSASTIKFPVSFNGKERRVEITGEAYFEIKHNDKMPFVVSVNGMEVHDLGTEFNINAYNDEPVISTTLVQGSVEVVKDTKRKILKPGEQTQLLSNGELTAAKEVNVNEFIAWKDDKFYFDGLDIHSIMRQLSRWYNVEVSYEADIPEHFTGIISRSVNVSEVFRMLEQTGAVKLTVEGNKIIVRK